VIKGDIAFAVLIACTVTVQDIFLGYNLPVLFRVHSVTTGILHSRSVALYKAVFVNQYVECVLSAW